MSIQAKQDLIGLYTNVHKRSVRRYRDVLGCRLSDCLPGGDTEEPAALDGIEISHGMKTVEIDKGRRSGIARDNRSLLKLSLTMDLREII
jgi:hypothetical protein